MTVAFQRLTEDFVNLVAVIPITSPIVLQNNLDYDENRVQYNARLVSHLFKQQPGFDYTEISLLLIDIFYL